MAELTWTLAWEADLSAADHRDLSHLLASIYPAHAAVLQDARSWSGARPEARIVGHLGGEPVAHLGILRRFLRVGTTGRSVLVGDVGLVGVTPDARGRGVGGALLGECASALVALRLPFGFLTCRPDVVPFYAHGGWVQIAGQVTRMIDNTEVPETYSGPALVLPVLSRVDLWPRSHMIVRDGLEV